MRIWVGNLLLPVLVITALPLAGCGFTPMYAAKQGSPATALAQMEVAQPDNRLEQLVRNELLRNIPPSQQSGSAYLLDLSVNESTATLLSATGLTRQRLTAFFMLKDKNNGKILFNGKSFADATYNHLGQQFSDQYSKEAAQRVAAKELAEDIRTRLAAWFAQR